MKGSAMRLIPTVLTSSLLYLPAAANAQEPAYITAAVSDTARPAEQRALDANRKPGDIIAFIGLKPGDRVVDFMPGRGYFTRLFSRIVGNRGHVFAFIPLDELRNCDASETAAARALAHDRNYRNLTVQIAPAEAFTEDTPVDIVWTSQNYHDLYDKFMGPTNVAEFNQQVFNALKPGGVYMIVDHVAPQGSGISDTETLHRIDPERIKSDVTAAGFVFEGESDVLRNPADPHTIRVFDPSIRGRTDQVILKFRKPRTAS
jgi:predicted methyltransferase